MKIAVIGAGSWGTALAQVLAGNGHNVGLWARKPEVVQADQRRAPQPALPERRGAFRAHRGHAVARGGAAARKRGRHRHAVQPACAACGRAGSTPPRTRAFPIVVCSKGVEEGSGLLPIDVMAKPRWAAASVSRCFRGPQPRRRGHPRGAGCHGGGQPLGGHGGVLPGAVRHARRSAPTPATTSCGVELCAGVQERHRHRRGPVLRHRVRRQHGGAPA